jgi:hypothetical protein
MPSNSHPPTPASASAPRRFDGCTTLHRAAVIQCWQPNTEANREYAAAGASQDAACWIGNGRDVRFRARHGIYPAAGWRCARYEAKVRGRGRIRKGYAHALFFYPRKETVTWNGLRTSSRQHRLHDASM